MFESVLDSEHVFGQRVLMHRTYVRRRRVTLTLVVVGLAAIVSGPVANAVGLRGPDDGMEPVAHRTYVVRDGDTLWSIATRVAHGGDPRPMVDAIEAENDVAAGALVPGMTLTVPAA
ncbi:MAG: LysM peptidoglycan-binding domain-containing protein [Actinomycetota bacterium]